MAGGYDSRRLLRILIISTVLFVGFGLLRPYGLGWLVVPAGLAVAGVFVGLSVWRNRRARRRLEAMKHELDAQDD